MAPQHFSNKGLVKTSGCQHVVMGSCIFNILEAPGPVTGMGT